MVERSGRNIKKVKVEQILTAKRAETSYPVEPNIGEKEIDGIHKTSEIVKSNWHQISWEKKPHSI